MKLFLMALILCLAPYPVCSAGLDLDTASFDEIIGADLPELLKSARIPEPENIPVLSRMPDSGIDVVPLPQGSDEETEIKKCPANAEMLTYNPDPDLFTYIGFRYVRSDDSTCMPGQSDRIYYQEAETRQIAFEGDVSSYAYDLSTREYRIRRDFYFRTHLDGTRSFYACENKQYTGQQIPETVKLEFVNRADYPLLPWESAETFRLEYGIPSRAILAPVATNYEYQIRSAAGMTPEGNLLTTLTAEVLRKKELTPAEPDAVSLTLARQGTGLTADIRDIRAKYYAGEKIGLRIRLWRNVILLGDKVAYDIEIGLDAASQTVIDFSDPRWDSFKQEVLSHGREYYAEWSFSRQNSGISSGEWIYKGKSNRIKL
ncbi:MAG: hypothetical protein ABIG11_01560 [bacterium]